MKYTTKQKQAVLSASNPGYIVLPSDTVGQFKAFTITADIITGYCAKKNKKKPLDKEALTK